MVIKKEIGARLRMLRESMSLSIVDVISRAHLPLVEKSWMSRVETGETTQIDAIKLQKVLTALGTSFDAFLRAEIEELQVEFTPKERDFLERWRTLNPAAQGMIENQIEFMLKQEEEMRRLIEETSELEKLANASSKRKKEG